MNDDIHLEDYFNLVHKLAKPFAIHSNSPNVRESDAYAEGLLALTKAKEGWDRNKGIKFITYAYWCIVYQLVAWRRKNKSLESINPDSISSNSRYQHFEFDEIEFFKSLVNHFPVDSNLRQIFELRLKGLQCGEIGEILGCSKQNVDQLFKRRILPVILEQMESKLGITRNKSSV